jgi:hypothetical protein
VKGHFQIRLELLHLETRTEHLENFLLLVCASFTSLKPTLVECNLPNSHVRGGMKDERLCFVYDLLRCIQSDSLSEAKARSKLIALRGGVSSQFLRELPDWLVSSTFKLPVYENRISSILIYGTDLQFYNI